MDRNCYYDASEADLSTDEKAFDDKTLAEWKKTRDAHSVVADPGFVNPAVGDFRLRSGKIAKRIGFKPFSLDNFGVYGSEEWKGKAAMPQERLEVFDRIVREREAAAPAIFRD